MQATQESGRRQSHLRKACSKRKESKGHQGKVSVRLTDVVETLVLSGALSSAVEVLEYGLPAGLGLGCRLRVHRVRLDDVVELNNQTGSSNL